MVKAGLQNRFLLVSGCTHPIAAGCEESFYPMARLFHVLNYKDGKTTLSIRCHGLLYERTSFSYQSQAGLSVR